ncbi:glycoside hydrolase family 2 TIM barrel-domain containing protein [Heminiphilus faecis]|uniref:Glycoside hydrolase family 2 TIM barrel-domain containing protein n=1 Tax=Heminiphilus faecis TaxID=2601703 RepID=A0ABV4CY62_9BACT
MFRLNQSQLLSPRIWLAATLTLCCIPAMTGQRTEKTINDGWEFRLPDAQSWQHVNLPHTYNHDAYSTRDYYRGKAHYRRRLAMDSVTPGMRYYLKCDAASKSAVIKVNGREAGSHNGGYSAFITDITDFVGTNNLIEVTVDNDRPDITPISADFTFWGGIYRDVWLVTVPDRHFAMNDYGSDGIFISTPEVCDDFATVQVRGKVSNDSRADATLEVRSEISDPAGKLLQTLTQKKKVKAGETAEFTTLSRKIDSPALWSPESPSLYTVKTTLVDAKTGSILDSRTHRTGFRWFEFDGHKGFSLNGKPYKLRGVNRHQDQWPSGVALADEAHRRDVRLMKDIGCNFIRISHYPQDDALLEACDRLGLLAWEEIPIVNIVPDTPGYDDNCEVNLIEMIRQHYNHTSIIAWGYMNEILLTAPNVTDPKWPACRERTVKLAQRLEKKLKDEDPSRASVMAFNMTNLYNEIGLDLEDVAGWNLYHGWYVGELDGFNRWCEDQHTRYPDHPIIISEWGAGSDRRLHSDRSKAFDFSIEYQQRYIEHYLPFIENTEWINGSTYWNFIDFNVAARQESMPRVNNKGLFYNDRTPKDVAYYFKSMWRDDIPVVHIAVRDMPAYIAEPGRSATIKVYANTPEVTLRVNGAEVATEKTDNRQALFNINLPEGTAVLTAKGTLDGVKATDAATLDVLSMPEAASGELAVNLGSNCYFTSDVTGLTWLPDRPYTPGAWGYTSGEERSTTSEIAGTVDGPLYQTWRQGPVAYRIDAPEGRYEVELLMADVTRPARQLANLLDKAESEQSSDDTRFDILIDDNPVETDFSPADGGRYRTAFKRRYIIDNNKGCISVSLRPIKGNPAIAAIKVRKL